MGCIRKPYEIRQVILSRCVICDRYDMMRQPSHDGASIDIKLVQIQTSAACLALSRQPPPFLGVVQCSALFVAMECVILFLPFRITIWTSAPRVPLPASSTYLGQHNYLQNNLKSWNASSMPAVKTKASNRSAAPAMAMPITPIIILSTISTAPPHSNQKAPNNCECFP